jgi:ring-1,2-phenylacetyl-CoA epoxidase subunit PaaC
MNTNIASTLTNNVRAALRDVLYKMADDALVIGHRNSEWVGLGPVLEEDIAFASIAQDKLGHALALYTILHEHLGEQDPDTIAFTRSEKQFLCCRFVEYPIGDYDFSLMRHFLFDTAESLRFDMLTQSAFEPLAQLSRKVRGEIKYHTMHANIWIKQLSRGTEESRARMQTALNETFPLALGIFEPSKFEDVLQSEELFEGEKTLQERWLQVVGAVCEQAGLRLPDPERIQAEFGGRNGYHTEYLQPLLDEMSEVFATDPTAEW